MMIFEHDGRTWFKICTYPHHNEDNFTKLPYAEFNQERETLMVPVDALGKPLIFAISDGLIWFISVDHDSNFAWLQEGNM